MMISVLLLTVYVWQAARSLLGLQLIIVGYRLRLPEEGLVVIHRYHAYLFVGIEYLP